MRTSSVAPEPLPRRRRRPSNQHEASPAIGIWDKDGSLSIKHLVKLGHQLHRMIHRASTFNTDRMDHLYQDRVKQDAQSHLGVSFQQFEYTVALDGLGTLQPQEMPRGVPQPSSARLPVARRVSASCSAPACTIARVPPAEPVRRGEDDGPRRFHGLSGSLRSARQQLNPVQPPKPTAGRAQDGIDPRNLVCHHPHLPRPQGLPRASQARLQAEIVLRQVLGRAGASYAAEEPVGRSRYRQRLPTHGGLVVAVGVRTPRLDSECFGKIDPRRVRLTEVEALRRDATRPRRASCRAASPASTSTSWLSSC
jgi:hypothetical protein